MRRCGHAEQVATVPWKDKYRLIDFFFQEIHVKSSSPGRVGSQPDKIRIARLLDNWYRKAFVTLNAMKEADRGVNADNLFCPRPWPPGYRHLTQLNVHFKLK